MIVVKEWDEERDAARYADAPPLEAGIVMFNRHGAGGARKFNALIQEAGFQIESVTAQHA
jgi:uncharacterized protein with PIN domain